MSFVERGIEVVIHRDAEWGRQMGELSSLSSEELKTVLNKSVIAGLAGDGGKYVLLFGALALSDKTPEGVNCIIFPLVVGGAAVGLSAEAYYGMRVRITKEILYERGVLTRPSVLAREIKEDFHELLELFRKRKKENTRKEE